MTLKLLKKLLIGTTIATMICLLTACGGDSKKTESSKTKLEEKEVTTNSTFKNLKIGVLNTGSASDTAGYTFAHAQGIKDALKNLGMSEEQVIWKDYISDTMDNSSDKQVLEATEDCIKNGAKLIFATSYGYKNVIKQLSDKYPDVYFAHATGDLSNGTNFINYFGRVYQARYLSGIAAGLKTKSNKVGFVSAWGIENSECTSSINAFAMGVSYVNPHAKVYVRSTNSWFDAEKEKAAAEYLIKKDCDVITQHVDTAEPQIAAEKAGVYGIGYNSDMTKEAPKAVLTSVVWHWDIFYTWAIKAVCDKTWDGKNYLGGLNEGMVSITPLTDLNNKNAAKKVEDATKKIKSGDWDVFMGIIPTNNGTTVGTEGTSLDNNTILFGMNWYYKNVVATNEK